uniref:Rib/alpha-like domain-containing protein n=1 Tax=Streptococcus mitis TaxID=28037 RepID=UPI00066AE75E
MFKPKGRHVRQSQVEKFTRYSIRKVSFGAASVAVATGLFFLGGGSVQAAEQLTNTEHTEVQNPQNVNEKSSEPSREVTGQASATAKEADGQNNTSVKESATDKQTSEVETPKVVTEKVAINTASLEDLVAKAESRLSQLTESKRTKSFIDDTKILVNKAKELLNDDTKTQAKVDALAKQLSSSLSVLNSIKSDATEEEKVNKNQDPRNGQAIPGNGESGFRADTFIVNESNTTTVPDTTTTGTDKFTFVAIPENDSRRNNKVIAIASGQAGDIEVKGTGNAPTDLEIEMYSSQRTGKQENPVAMSTVNGQPVTSPGRMDYPLSKEQVQKLQEEAKLWRNKLKPDGNSISNNPATVFGSSGAYEFLATEIYKMGYEQGVDRAYIPNISNRFAVTDKAKEAGWKIKSISPTNLPSGLIYDKESDSIQGRVVSNVQNGVQDLRFTVEAENEKTHQIVSMEFRNLRSGWIAWQDSKPPKLEVSDDAYETQVGKNVNIDIAYKDDAGSNFSGSRRQVNYRLASGKVVAIPNQNFRQAISGLAGYATTKQAGELDGTKTSIPGISYSLSQDGTPVETDENGDQSIYGKAKLSGTATTAGIYTVSVFAKDYNTTKKSDSTWIHSGHEVQKYITVVVKPTITVKNVHAYATTIPVTISDGASTAEVKLPNGKITKLEVRDGQWVVASGTTNEKAVQGTALGQVGSEINIPVSEEDTKDASTDTIVAKAITENVKATLLRNELSLTDNNGVHKARLDETTGHWELDKNYREVKESTPDGGYKLTKRQVFTEVQTDGTINYYIYSYTRTYKANDEIVSVDEVRRDKTVVPRLNTENKEGNSVVVEYNPVTQTWTSSDNSRVTATKEGNFWNIRTESGFTGLVKGSIAESDDKASILNNAPTASSTSYTTVKGATVDLVKQASAAVTIKDTEDDSTTSPKKETTITKVTVTAPSGQQSEYTDLEQAKAHLLSEVGTYTVKVEVKDSNGNIVTADTETDTGTNKGADTAVNSTTYTITVKDQPTNKLYTVEGDTVTNDQLKEKVVPTEVDGFTATKNDIADIPTTAKKAGQTLEVPATVTYTKGTETISVATKVDVVVLPKVEPTGVTVLKDSTNLEETVKAKAVEAATAVPTDKLPAGVTVSVKEVKQGTVPATSTTGVQNPATVVIEYKDANNNVVATKEVTVPVTVVGSTASDIVVFEGEKPTAEQAKAAVTPGTDGTKGEPTTLPETTGKAGATDVKVDVPVTYDNGKLTETVKVPVTVLPKASGEVEVPKGSTVDKVKEVAKAKAKTLTESADFTGKLPAGATVTVGDITEAVAETLTNEKGTNKGVVNVPATYTVGGKTYNTTVPVTINVLGSDPKTVYTVEGTKPDAEKVKNAVTPGTGGTVGTPTETDLPETTGKVGAKDVTVPTTVTYSTGDETVNVPVEVLPKATPEKVITLKDTTSDSLKTAVKEKAQAALGKLALPSGVTAELVPNQDYTVPTTDSNGDKDAVPVKVQYKDATGTVVAEDTINVPVTVVSSTPSKVVVFEGEKPTAEQAKTAVTPGTDGTKGEPTTLPETVGKAGATDITVDVPVTYDNGKLTETVKVPVTVLPKPEADEILVAKNSDKEKAKEKVLAQAEKAIADGTFTGKLPQGAKVEIDKTAPVTVPDLTDDTEVDVTVKYTVDGEEKTTTVKVPVTVVEGVPQIVPVDENNKQPDPEKSIDKTDYPEGSTFRYKTPDGQTSPIDVTTTGDKNVVVEVLDPQGNTIVEVPATVRVVGSTPQFVVADPAKKQPEAKDSVTPGEYPDGTTFEYKTPVDTTTAGEKDVTVVAKLNGQPIAEVPAKVVVVDPKTQYVVADPSKPQPDAAKSIDPEQYPEGTTFEYKTPVDTTTPGEKDVVVIAKDGNDTLVEVPTKVKVVQGYPQIVPVDEGKKQPSPEDSIDSNDYPDDATFEYKEEVDTSKPGDKKVTVVVKQGDKVLVEVPSTVRVVEGYPKYVPVDPAKKQPDPKENINPNDFPTGTTFEYKDNTPVDTTTPGDKPVTVVAKLNGQPITEIPATIVVVEPKTQYVPVNAENDKKPKPKDSITPDDYPEGSTFEYKTPEEQATPYDGTTPGEKDVTVVVKDSDGDTIVEVPAKIKVVQGKEQLTPVNAEDKDKPKAEDSITPSDYPEGSTFEYKVPEGQTTPYDGSTPGDKPVTVVVKDKDGKVLVEVPATIKVVETKPTPIETPVTNTPLKEEDYTRGLNIPDGATAKVGDLPDLTTPGEKTPVKVTITLPNGKSYTVDIPVTVTPVKEIETPVTTEKLTPENVLKQIKVPEGATTKVGDLPDLTTPGKKDPVKVTITLPNGKVVTVDVPVTVTPVKEIETPVTTAKLTPEDILKQIKVPEGATTEVGDLPDLTTPGKKDPVKVTVTLPNGKVITVDVPVNVTPVKEIETPVTKDKLTPEDILKQIKVP